MDNNYSVQLRKLDFFKSHRQRWKHKRWGRWLEATRMNEEMGKIEKNGPDFDKCCS